MIYKLRRTEAEAVFMAGRIAHLGCIVDDEPYVVPVRYVAEDGVAYLQSLPGRKIDAMRECSQVCLQVEEIDSEYHWRSVQVFGKFEEVENADEREWVFSLIWSRFPHLTPADPVRRYGHSDGSTIAFRVRVDRIVGIGEG